MQGGTTGPAGELVLGTPVHRYLLAHFGALDLAAVLVDARGHHHRSTTAPGLSA